MKVIFLIVSANFFLLGISSISAQDFLILQFPELELQFERSLTECMYTMQTKNNKLILLIS